MTLSTCVHIQISGALLTTYHRRQNGSVQTVGRAGGASTAFAVPLLRSKASTTLTYQILIFFSNFISNNFKKSLYSKYPILDVIIMT